MKIFETVQRYLGESTPLYIVAFVILIGGSIILLTLNRILKRELKKGGKSKVLLTFLSKNGIPLAFLAVVAISIRLIPLNPNLQKTISSAFTLIVTIVIIRAIITILESTFNNFLGKGDINRAKSLTPLFSLIKFLIWTFAVIFLLSNLGFDVTAALAGLGIGGIAVAIAAQGILGDLFSYFVVYLDKPFEIGDFIVFGDSSGVVERIGIKSSRIRALSGEVLVLSNSVLTSSQIHNYKQMEQRRVAFSIRVPYETSVELLQLVPSFIKEAIELIKEPKGITLSYSNLNSLLDRGCTFETVYYVPSPDYVVYMEIQQQIYLNMIKIFNEKGLSFAYPTQKFIGESL